MIIGLIVFLILCFIEYVFYFIKKSEIEDAHTLAKIGSKILDLEKEYNSLVGKVVKFVNTQNKFWIKVFIGGVIVINIILSVIVASVISFLIFLYQVLT